jgi:hypothetical protein
MTTEIVHEPTPEFRDFLEDEVTRAFRHHRFFSRLRVVAIIVASLGVGTTAGLASAQIREGAQRDSLLEAAMSDLALVALRLDLARARHEDVSKKVKSGVVGSASLLSAESELRSMEAQAARAKLNVDEIRATSMAPRDDINAPVVNGRDFVTERLQLDLFAAQQRLVSAEQALAEVERQARVGAVGELASLDASLEVARARAALGTLAEQRTLRKEFTEQGTPGEQLLLRLQQARLRYEAMAAQEALLVSRRRKDAVQKQFDAGVALELDLLRAKVDLMVREVEMRVLAIKLRDLKKP